MSQSQPMGPAAPSTARIALALGVVGLVLGASALGYALYLGLSQVPSQVSSLSVNQKPTNRDIRVEWFLSNQTGFDRFTPTYITVNQGDNLTITLVTNDTSDGHTFTIPLTMKGLGTTAIFQLNNSWTGLSSGPFLIPQHVFTGGPTGCSDGNGAGVTCTTQRAASDPSGNCNHTTGVKCDLKSTGWLGYATVPGVYRFFCFYHQKGGMYGFLVVLPNAYPGASSPP